jgi:hypothetical protein
MPIVPKPGENTFLPAPSGTHPAVCYRVLDLGTQETNYQGQAKKTHRIMLTWELMCEERMSDGRPFSMSKSYTWSMHEKATLRKDLEGWRGKAFADGDFHPETGFRIEKLLGVPCLLTVVHEVKNDQLVANIKSVSKLPKQMTVGVAENDYVYLWLSVGEFDKTVFERLSPRLQETIRKSPEYQSVIKGKDVEGPQNFDAGHDPSDEIPF